MPVPTLVVVSGRPGAGETTLAHELARGIGCPAICRDEIKEGMVRASPGFEPGPGDPLSMRTLTVFFDLLEVLLRAGVTTVAEAAFQDRLWRPGLQRLTGLAELRIVQCTVDPDVARARSVRRDAAATIRRAAHESTDRPVTPFEPITLDVPTIEVDSTDGYTPSVPEIVAFLIRR